MLISARGKSQETPSDRPQQLPTTPLPVDTGPQLTPDTETRLSTDVLSGSLPVITTTLAVTTAPVPALSPAAKSAVSSMTGREPVVIRGSGKKRASSVPGAKHKHPLFVVGAIAVSLLVILTALAFTIPVSKAGRPLLSLGGSGQISLTDAKGNNAGIDIAAQAVTATAITEAGYTGDYYSSGTIITGNPADQAHLNRFAAGNCTYWANYRYHQLTGIWVDDYFIGNAYEWYYNAQAAGWHYSDSPNPNGPSILVMGPYTMGNGALGHVAVVEQVNAGAGSATVSSWNWGAQNWGVTTYMDVPYPMAGLNYIWL